MADGERAPHTVADYFARQGKGRSPSEIERDLKGKSKAEVKEYFGRPPDAVKSKECWSYKGRWYDPDSEKTMIDVWVRFNDGKVLSLSFFDF